MTKVPIYRARVCKRRGRWHVVVTYNGKPIQGDTDGEGWPTLAEATRCAERAVGVRRQRWFTA